MTGGLRIESVALALGLVLAGTAGCATGQAEPRGRAPEAQRDSGTAPDVANDAKADSARPAEDAGGVDAHDVGLCASEPLAGGDPLSSLAVACDDGTGSLGTGQNCPIPDDLRAVATYHLRISGPGFVTSGACIYVTPGGCDVTRGDVMQFSGGSGTDLDDGYDPTLTASPYCFRMLDVRWDAMWEDDGLQSGGPAGQGGNILVASQKPHALITWVHTYLRSSPKTPLCARGNSGGSSELLYELMHNGGERMLDHVQLTSATPFARLDVGCDPTTPAQTTGAVCSTLPATTSPVYGGAAEFIRAAAHEPACDAAGAVLTSAERTALQAMSLLTPDFTPITLGRTSLSAFMCSQMPNETQGQAVYVFGPDADLAALGRAAYGGVVSLSLGTPFYGCPPGESCPPHVVCSDDCSAEGFGENKANDPVLFDDLAEGCVLRH